MFVSIGMDNFDSEIKAEKRSVLLACIRRDDEFKEQTAVLDNVSKRYGERLKVCLLDEDSFGAFSKKLGIEGTPTFIAFYAGKEKGRMLGKADRETLSSFILRTVPDSHDKKPSLGSGERIVNVYVFHGTYYQVLRIA